MELNMISSSNSEHVNLIHNRVMANGGSYLGLKFNSSHLKLKFDNKISFLLIHFLSIDLNTIGLITSACKYVASKIHKQSLTHMEHSSNNDLQIV